MNDANAIPWDGLMIMATTIAVIFGLDLLLQLLVRLVVGARDELRDRYFGGGWRPGLVDLLGVPIWAGLELTCLLGGLLLALLTILALYSLARDFRDWWHEDDRGR